MESRSLLEAKHNVISWLTTMTFENSFAILFSKAESSYVEMLQHVPTRSTTAILFRNKHTVRYCSYYKLLKFCVLPMHTRSCFEKILK